MASELPSVAAYATWCHSVNVGTGSSWQDILWMNVLQQSLTCTLSANWRQMDISRSSAVTPILFYSWWKWNNDFPTSSKAPLTLLFKTPYRLREAAKGSAEGRLVTVRDLWFTTLKWNVSLNIKKEAFLLKTIPLKHIPGVSGPNVYSQTVTYIELQKRDIL